LVLSWCLGWEARGHGEDALAVIDDAVHATITPPRLSFEVRVLLRVIQMEQDAATARERLAQQAQRNAEHDRRVLAAAGIKDGCDCDVCAAKAGAR
jgi:hypothetical protein